MNLDKILTGAIQDLTWLDDGVTFNPEGHDEPNDIKPELEFELGYGDIDPKYSEIKYDEVERNIPSNEVVKFASMCLNRGIMGQDLVVELKGNFDTQTLRDSAEGLKEVLKGEGIVGCVAVDATYFDSCQEALRYSSQSPFKRYVKYIIGCDCGTCDIADGRKSVDKELKASDNSVDSFFNADDLNHEVSTNPYCKTTMMPVINAYGDLQEEDMDGTMIDLMNITEVTDDEDDSKKEAHIRVSSAFKKAYESRKATNVSYSEKIDASEYAVDQDSSLENFNVDREIKRESVDVGFDSGVDGVSVDKEAKVEASLDVDPKASDMDFDIGSSVFGSIDIDERQGDLDMEIAEQTASISDIDISEYRPEGFDGIDIVSLDENVEKESDLDIDMTEGFSF
jgi:hypothetical protein